MKRREKWLLAAVVLCWVAIACLVGFGLLAWLNRDFQDWLLWRVDNSPWFPRPRSPR